MAANNFASPRLDPEAMLGEMKIIDSEFNMVKGMDAARIIQVLKEVAIDNHLLRQFAWGNLKSLQSDDTDALWADLKKFHEEHYSSDRIAMVISC
jgi:secreted Zn-dependent insulinase-like peptidase